MTLNVFVVLVIQLMTSSLFSSLISLALLSVLDDQDVLKCPMGKDCSQARVSIHKRLQYKQLA